MATFLTVERVTKAYSMLTKIKKEIIDFSTWFKIAIVLLFLIYAFFWIFTIHLSGVQKDKGYSPVLPVVAEDSQEFASLSESIMKGDGFMRFGEIETLRTPGYPVFVAIIWSIFGSYFAVTLVQIFLVFAGALLVRKIGIWYGGKLVGELSAFLLLANPVTLVLSLVILTDVLFFFLFALGFYLALSAKKEKVFSRIFIVSIVFSYAIYVRPMGFFALPIFAAPILCSKLSKKFQWKLVALMMIILALSTIPWSIRNYKQTGVFGFTSFKALNLSFAATLFLSDLHHTSVSVENLNFEKQSGVPEAGWRDLKYSKEVSSTAENIIFSNLFSYAKFHVVTSAPFLFPSTIDFASVVYRSSMHEKAPFAEGSIHDLVSGNWLGFLAAVSKVWWKFAERLLWFVALVFAIFGVWQERKKLLTWAFFCIVLYLMFLAGPASGPRYSFQAWPYFFMLFGIGLFHFYKKFSK